AASAAPTATTSSGSAALRTGDMAASRGWTAGFWRRAGAAARRWRQAPTEGGNQPRAAAGGHGGFRRPPGMPAAGDPRRAHDRDGSIRLPRRVAALHGHAAIGPPWAIPALPSPGGAAQPGGRVSPRLPAPQPAARGAGSTG